LLAATFGVGLVFKRLRVPAAFLLAGMFVSAIGHGAGLTPGRMPGPVVYVAFLVMGVLIGSRFGGKTVEELRGCVAAGAWITGVNVVMALLAVAVCMWLLGASPALLIVAFSPGGVEAMAAIAVSLGLDPAFVAAHHVMRLVLLTFLVPAILASAAKQE
jgi:membrane AbrB-like protein